MPSFRAVPRRATQQVFGIFEINHYGRPMPMAVHIRELAGRRSLLADLEARAERMPSTVQAVIQSQIFALRQEIADLERLLSNRSL